MKTRNACSENHKNSESDSDIEQSQCHANGSQEFGSTVMNKLDSLVLSPVVEGGLRGLENQLFERHDNNASGDKTSHIPKHNTSKQVCNTELPPPLSDRVEPVRHTLTHSVQTYPSTETTPHQDIAAVMKTVVAAIENLRQDVRENNIHQTDTQSYAIPQRRHRMTHRMPQAYTRAVDHTSSEDSDNLSEPDRVHFSSHSEHSRRGYTQAETISRTGARLPAFTGKESWVVYYNRFQEIADRNGWNNEHCLDELLPKLQGSAGEFVFNQLSAHTRKDYQSLIVELNNRFRVIEHPRTFQMKFSRRDQNPGESIEAYVADLKRLYDKAYPQRAHETRDEDLLRRFLDGVINEKASFHVEYVKGPQRIDEAAFEIINFLEARGSSHGHTTRRRNGDSARMVRSAEDSDSDFESDESEVTVTRVRKLHKRDYKSSSGTLPASSAQHTTKVQSNEAKYETSSNENKRDMEHRLKCMENAIQQLTEKVAEPVRQLGSNSPMTHTSPDNTRRETRTCFNCGTVGHLSRDCRQPRVQRNHSMSNNNYRGYATHQTASSRVNRQQANYSQEMPTWPNFQGGQHRPDISDIHTSSRATRQPNHTEPHLN